MERLTDRAPTQIEVCVLDFDGTLSLLRRGWESVMMALFLDRLAMEAPPDQATRDELDRYIHASAGLQTILQMEWFSRYLHGRFPDSTQPEDPWFFKDRYNERLMDVVGRRIRDAQDAGGRECTRVASGTGGASGTEGAGASGIPGVAGWLVPGALAFLQALRAAKVRCCIASGTDHEDVLREAALLGVLDLVSEVRGAPRRSRECSKEALVRGLLEDAPGVPERIAVVGDGRVEIEVARRYGALALGIASDEENPGRLNVAKRDRLVRAGADRLVPDFTELPAILDWMGLGSSVGGG